MTYDEETIAELLGALPPAPPAWVEAAQQLPALRRTREQLMQRAEGDAEFRRAVEADIEATLREFGYDPDIATVAALRAALSAR